MQITLSLSCFVGLPSLNDKAVGRQVLSEAEVFQHSAQKNDEATAAANRVRIGALRARSGRLRK
ncbi:hypothetical protein CBM2633_P10020 [Cupriavidus taiwanensis]|uniref:Uncharacterized protein n=2 Tax=Cupriavidus TaxID=106589 RepID=A0A375HTP3_9BURK|nr:hypothetical protein CBM2592_P10020 [Cupriavidus taiwanensis]SOZ40367.1 hypothetical protein CBM2605_P10020 [Cupriavidus neocaledonicus]SOY73997.1 hypothetical protein CBM2588_P10020 [Cupriavidus taiwanensis]SOY74274.1 hypothetical protein CBM2585_P10019 [Cupriavidus taiwanensis]SOY75224.1 hypothetical protein CBM2589_P10020 [Cupriavidus taiwanensis]